MLNQLKKNWLNIIITIIINILWWWKYWQNIKCENNTLAMKLILKICQFPIMKKIQEGDSKNQQLVKTVISSHLKTYVK